MGVDPSKNTECEPDSAPLRPSDVDATRVTAFSSSEDAGTPTSLESSTPLRLGRYAIVRVLGEGGMGIVYEARQENPKRTVGLKVIRPGYMSPDLLRRFEQESQVLARLQHPGIAQVYEAGTVEDEKGRALPFFAMEFIRGVPLPQYAASKNLGARDRLELVAKICDAVYHAHQKGVIHRDIKPANIVVDDTGQPKVLDFGVARATDSDIQQTTVQTDVGQIVGTVPYMSPEQVGGDPNELDTRSDVYALGVIAYELLASRPPYDLKRKMIHEAARIIREEEPTRLSSIDRTLKGDIETIVAKAMEKEKSRRYQSAESLASDIRRYLRDEPIAARPASTWYQLEKLSRRNRGLVASVLAAFLLLVAGLIGTSYGLRQAVMARDNERLSRKDAELQKDAAIIARNAAEAQRDKAEKIAEFMSDMLQGAGPSVAQGRDTTMLKEMVDAAAARIEKGDLKSAPEAELRLRGTIGDTFRQLAQYDAAQRMLEPAVALARSMHPGDHAARVDAVSNMALLLRDRGDVARADPLLREALEMQRRLVPGDSAAAATCLNNLAGLCNARGDLAGAEALLRQALEMRQRLFPGDHPDVAICLNNLASLLNDRGDFDGAERLLRQALEMKRHLLPGDHPSVAAGLNNLASFLQDRGELAQAEPLVRESLEMRRRLFPGGHPVVARSLSNLAVLLVARGDPTGAEPLLRESLEMQQRMLGNEHAETLDSRKNLANVLVKTGRHDQARPLVEACVAGCTRAFGPAEKQTREALALAASLYESWDKAEPGKGYDAMGAQWKAKLDAVASSHEASVTVPPGD